MNASKDWEQFINEILDGLYAMDIKKTGSVSMFVKNQLGAYSHFHRDCGAFLKALEAKWQKLEGTANDCLDHPLVYQTLLQLGTSFLPSSELFLIIVSSLYVQLKSMKDLRSDVDADRKPLLSQCNHALVSFIEAWKRKFAPIEKHDFLFVYPFVAVVVESWKEEIDRKWMEDYHPVIGLIYLEQWQTIRQGKRAGFLQSNDNNRALLRSLISDMELKRKENIFNYSSFQKDLITYQEQLLPVLENRGLLPTVLMPKEKDMFQDYNKFLRQQAAFIDSSDEDLNEEYRRISLIKEHMRFDSLEYLEVIQQEPSKQYQFYFDAVDVIRMLQGVNRFYKTEGSKRLFDASLFDEECVLIHALALGKFLKSGIKLLPTHQAEFSRKVKESADRHYHIFFHDQNLLKKFLEEDLNFFEKLQEMVQPPNQDEENREVRSWISEKNKEIFKAIFLSYKASYNARFRELFEGKIIQVGSYQMEDIEIYDNSLFWGLTTAFRKRRPNKVLSSNFNDVAALMYLAKLVKAYNADNNRPLPIYYDSHKYASYLPDDILKRHFTVVTRTVNGNEKLYSLALRGHDFFILYAFFHYKTQEISIEEQTYEEFIKGGESATILEKLVESSGDAPSPEVRSWYQQANARLKEKILNYVQVDFFKVLLENISQNRLEVINTILQDFRKEQLNEEDTDTLTKRNELFLRYLHTEITELLQETVNTFNEIQFKIRQVARVAEQLLREHNQKLDIFYHYSMSRFFLPKEVQTSLRHFFSEDGLLSSDSTDSNFILGTLWNYYCRTVYYRRHPHVLSKQLLDTNGQYILYGSFWVLGLEDKLFQFNIRREHLEDLDHSLLMLIGATIDQAITLSKGDKEKHNRYAALYAAIISILENRLTLEQASQEQRAQIHIVLAYLYFHLWFQQGNKGWLSCSEEERENIVYGENNANHKATHFANQAYQFYRNQNPQNKATYLYTLNIYLYYIIEAAPNEEFQKIAPLKEEFNTLKGTIRNWHFRYDDTLARNFHRLAILVPFADKMTFINQAIQVLSDSLSSVRALEGKEIEKLRAYLCTLVDIKGQLMMDITESSYVPSPNSKTRTYTSLIGRKKQIEEVLERIRRPQPVTAIVGRPGVGKTSLALEIARISKGQSDLAVANAISFESVIWISMNDYESKQNVLNQIFDEIGRATGYIKITQISDTELIRKEKEVNEVLRIRNILLIIDSYEANQDLNLERWIQSIMPPSEVLLTTLRNPSFHHNTYWLPALSEEEAMEFIQKQAELQGLSLGELAQKENMKGLIRITGAIPQAIIVALGMIRQGALKPEDLNEANVDAEPIGIIYEKLYTISWEALHEQSKGLLFLFLIFNSQYAIDRNALLKVSRLDKNTFNKSMRELCDWNLLSSDLANEHYSVHPTLVGFLNKKLVEPLNYERIKTDFIEYYLDFLKRTIVRQMPEEPYWNALVSDNMKHIESDWPAILQAINWAGEPPSKDDELIEFAILLVHYMDSRFYNKERLDIVNKAIKACQRIGDKNKYVEALLKIDALSWTNVEENDLIKANQSIVEGYRILMRHVMNKEAESYLKALSAAWLARTKAEQGQWEHVNRLIKKALLYTIYRDRKPWISFRIFMGAGDIAFKRKNHREAFAYYQKAKKESNLYGGEGNDYQINPRLGLAYLSTGELDKAEELFAAVRDKHEITIGKLYGEYGLAMVMYERGDREKANRKMEEVKEEIYKRGNNNLLLTLILEYEKVQKEDFIVSGSKPVASG